MGMAANSWQWVDQLAPAVTDAMSDMIAPLESMFTFHYPEDGQGIDAVLVPSATGTLSMTSITPGTISGSGDDSDYSFSGTTITPAPYAVKIPLAEEHLRKAQPSQVQGVINAMAEAGYDQLITLIETAVAALTVLTGGTSGAALTADLFKTAKWKLRAAKASGPLYSVLTIPAFEDLEVSLETAAAPLGSVGQDAVNGVDMFRYSGVQIYPDAYLGNDGTDGYSFISTKDGLHVAWGLEPTFKILPTTDPVNVRLAMKMWVAVGTPNPNKILWLKSKKD